MRGDAERFDAFGQLPLRFLSRLASLRFLFSLGGPRYADSLGVDRSAYDGAEGSMLQVH